MARRRVLSEGSRSGFCLGSACAGESQEEGALFPCPSTLAGPWQGRSKRASFLDCGAQALAFDSRNPRIPCLGKDWLLI